MIRNVLAATAVATVIAARSPRKSTRQPAPAAPADPATPAPMEQAAGVAPAEGHLFTNIVGETVYNGTGQDAQNIGDANDLVIDKDGKVKSIAIGVGGFLGIGEKSVEMAYDKIEWAERQGDRWIVVAGLKERTRCSACIDRYAL